MQLLSGFLRPRRGTGVPASTSHSFCCGFHSPECVPWGPLHTAQRWGIRGDTSGLGWGKGGGVGGLRDLGWSHGMGAGSRVSCNFTQWVTSNNNNNIQRRKKCGLQRESRMCRLPGLTLRHRVRTLAYVFKPPSILMSWTSILIGQSPCSKFPLSDPCKCS